VILIVVPVPTSRHRAIAWFGVVSLVWFAAIALAGLPWRSETADLPP
jgi:hypothetical protein